MWFTWTADDVSQLQEHSQETLLYLYLKGQSGRKSIFTRRARYKILFPKNVGKEHHPCSEYMLQHQHPLTAVVACVDGDAEDVRGLTNGRAGANHPLGLSVDITDGVTSACVVIFVKMICKHFRRVSRKQRMFFHSEVIFFYCALSCYFKRKKSLHSFKNSLSQTSSGWRGAWRLVFVSLCIQSVDMKGRCPHPSLALPRQGSNGLFKVISYYHSVM